MNERGEKLLKKIEEFNNLSDEKKEELILLMKFELYLKQLD